MDCINETVIVNLKSCGLDELFIGLESGNQRVLNQYKKGHSLKQAEQAISIIRKHNIKLQFGYIMIDPTLTIDELENNIKWILKLGGYSKHNLYNKLNLYYGTDLYYSLKKYQINDDTPFYERKISYFSDKRVECFSKIIDYCKNKFSKYNRNINEFFLSKIRNGIDKCVWEYIAYKIEDEETKIWTSIIITAFDEAKKNSFNKDYWDSILEEKLNILNCNFEFFKNEGAKLDEK